MKRIWFVLMTVVLLSFFTVNVSAAEGLPDLTQKGSLTFNMKYDGELLHTGAVNICYVADLEKKDSVNFEFQLIEVLQNPLLDMTDLTNPELAADLLYQVKKNRLPKMSASVRDGKVIFADLTAGLYLVWQEEADAVDDFLPIQPFLISVPLWQGDSFVFEAVASPKMPINPTPSVTPTPTPSVTPTPTPSGTPTPTPSGTPTPTPTVTPTPPPNLPQTGQLNWPIPVLAFSGAVLFVVGLLLCVSGKRRSHEK